MKRTSDKASDGPKTATEVYGIMGICVWRSLERDGLARTQRPSYPGLVRVGRAVLQERFRNHISKKGKAN